MSSTPFRQLHHICIVVHDIEQAVAYYESIGIGPWESYPPLTGFTTLDSQFCESVRLQLQPWYRWLRFDRPPPP